MATLSAAERGRVDVDPDHDVATRGQLRAHAPRPAAGIEDPGPRYHHGVEQARLTSEVHSFGGHLSEPVDVPLRVLGTGVGEPTRRRAHAGNLDRPAASASPWPHEGPAPFDGCSPKHPST